MSQFKFRLKQSVQIAVSQECGTVVGRAEYSTADNTYLLRYQCADGRATEAWWAEEALKDLPCGLCGGSGLVRDPYSAHRDPCPECTSRPSSMATDTTADSVNPLGSNA